MAISYDFFRNANTMDTNRERYHPRPTHSESVSDERLVKELQELSGLSAGSVVSVLSSLNQLLKRHLIEGNTVSIDGIGVFSISLTAPETRTPTATRASSISVKSVNFRCDKGLKDYVANNATFTRNRIKVQSPTLNESQLIAVLLKHFKTDYSLNRKQFQQLTLLNTSTAIRRLRSLRKDGYIANISTDRQHPIYVPSTKLKALMQE